MNPSGSNRLPASLEGNRNLGRWITVHKDGTVTVRPGKVEIGQGILTALVQIVAEELDVRPDRIRVVPAATTNSPNEGVTSGSLSVQNSGAALRYAAAEVREILVGMAARKLNCVPSDIEVIDGAMCTPTGRSITYWDLASDGLFDHDVSGCAQPKSPSNYTVVGRALPRIDIPGKVEGRPVYVHDLELPGMVHARVVRPPGPGKRLLEVDVTSVEAMPGVVVVIRDGSFLAVVAEREEQSIQAWRRLMRIAQWEGGGTQPATADPRYLLAMPSEDEIISAKGAVEPLTIVAEYSRQHIAHASIGPSCAIAEFRGGRYAVWTHSQGIYPLRTDLAVVLGMPENDVKVHHVEGAGCYGHNGADDAACDAVLIARILPGRPVRVQWMREDEFAWEPFGSPMVVRVGATLTDGRITTWTHDVWSHAHSTRPGNKSGVNLLAAWHLARPFAAAVPANAALPAGGSHRNAIPLYTFPNQSVTNHLIRTTPIRTSALRSLGAHANVFAIESFMDELAAASDQDPITFRLRHLEDPRAEAVIQKVAAMANWKYEKEADGERGQGVAFAKYKNMGAYVAVVVDLVAGESLRVSRAWAAVDVGQVINPDGVRNQIEGGIVQAISYTLKEAVQFDPEAVTGRNWDGYPILRFEEVPDIRIEIIDRPGLPSVGAGEGMIGPAAAAIANACYRALGTRLRDMPFTRERLLAALA